MVLVALVLFQCGLHHFRKKLLLTFVSVVYTGSEKPVKKKIDKLTMRGNVNSMLSTVTDVLPVINTMGLFLFF